VRVTSHRRARTALIATLLAPALLLSGCGGGDAKGKPKPKAAQPTGNVDVPDGITLTLAGTSLKFREPAVVAYEPNKKRSSVLSLSVDSVQAGRMADFAAYQLDTRTKRSRPYYVRVSVKNVGTGDLSRLSVPINAVDKTNTLVQPSSFTNTYSRCPSLPLPAGFGAGKSYKGCLVYFVPNGGSLVQMSYRPQQAFEPITWKGTILPVKAVKKKADSKKGSTKKAKP